MTSLTCSSMNSASMPLRPMALSGTRAHDVRTMGDKSPKSMRKQADQKQTKTNDDNRKKQAAVAAKQVVAAKKK
jgi:hypothetical protein